MRRGVGRDGTCPPARIGFRVGAAAGKVKATALHRSPALEVLPWRWYAGGRMPLPTPRRVALPLPLLGALGAGRRPTEIATGNFEVRLTPDRVVVEAQALSQMQMIH